MVGAWPGERDNLLYINFKGVTTITEYPNIVMNVIVAISHAYSGIEEKREINLYKEGNGCHAIISHKPIQPACQHCQC
jgi:hypothetical protein